MTIYTKTGDGGKTGLIGGNRVSKSDPRVEAYGVVDELNASLGWALSQLGGLSLENDLLVVQADLMRVGTELATPGREDEGNGGEGRRLGYGPVRRLEVLIDRLQAELPPLRNLILPGGSPAASSLQLCRTVCRRAERRVISLAALEAVEAEIIVYLNRLSDALFVAARWVNAQAGP